MLVGDRFLPAMKFIERKGLIKRIPPQAEVLPQQVPLQPLLHGIRSAPGIHPTTIGLIEEITDVQTMRRHSRICLLRDLDRCSGWN